MGRAWKWDFWGIPGGGHLRASRTQGGTGLLQNPAPGEMVLCWADGGCPILLSIFPKTLWLF